MGAQLVIQFNSEEENKKRKKIEQEELEVEICSVREDYDVWHCCCSVELSRVRVFMWHVASFSKCLEQQKQQQQQQKRTNCCGPIESKDIKVVCERKLTSLRKKWKYSKVWQWFLITYFVSCFFTHSSVKPELIVGNRDEIQVRLSTSAKSCFVSNLFLGNWVQIQKRA